MLNGLSESQIKELNEELAKLPSCFGEVKEAILSRDGNGYWYPLSGKNPAMKAVVYSLERIYDDDRIDLIKSVLERAGIVEVTGFHPYWFEHSRESKWKNIPDMKTYLYEKDDAGYNFPWICEEYYYDKSESWIIYVSHESTIAFAGEQLSGISETIIPDRYRY